MKALVKAKAQTGIWMEDVAMPAVGPNDVLIKIKKTAICGTDIHIYNWDEWAQEHIQVPLVIGHEFVGEVVEIGKEVTSYFNPGDRVSGEGHIACGHCRNCRAGRSHLCRRNVSVGVTRNGCFAEYLSIPATNAYPIPPSIPDSQAAILDPFGNATHSALSFDLVGEDVLITGAGPVGIMAAAIARHVGARHVVITDVNAYRLELAKKMGATLAVNPAKTSLREVMDQLNMKEGFDVGLEMSGNAKAFNDMITYMNHAGKIALLGFLPHGTGIDWSQIIMKGIIIKGIYGREMYDTWYKMITMLQSGLDIAPVITHEFSIDEYQQAFETMRSGQSGKVIMNWE
ncbi:L-threonine 3-dehydrogenase [Aquicella lusitana]|uniref:L-threonine 3-dehydrogenase n=1 Tax=Aquicella lusitana TaxID=254246 RepID=A0A370GHG4_9COXI|nr:L-threonine 3-dehydrogenase [Aquicella lusitana]RDI42686.1 L-threonine 3-dehydrogenase [Aquicella lusitana]VVC73459.1 L-threonine 3-dehydrogenase [Aquicella lusitana]